MTYVQWTGIFLTFLGLYVPRALTHSYLYNQSKNDAQTPRGTPGQEADALPMHHRSPLRPATKPTPPGPRARPRPANLSHAVATPLFSLPPQ